MNPDDIIQKMKDLTEEIKAKEGQLTEDNLEDFLGGVSESIAQVFAIAQNEINNSLQNIELAKECLLKEGLDDEAATVAPLVGNVLSVQNQLDIGREVAEQKRDFEDFSNTLEPETLLTPQVAQRFRELEQAMGTSRRSDQGEP